MRRIIRARTRTPGFTLLPLSTGSAYPCIRFTNRRISSCAARVETHKKRTRFCKWLKPPLPFWEATLNRDPVRRRRGSASKVRQNYETSTQAPSSSPRGAAVMGPADAPPLTVVDLFCGAGGLSLGLQRAGWHMPRSIDHFRAAVETYRRNLGDHVSDENIHEEILLPSATMIVGGPPCQGFSSAGLRRVKDGRNTLVSVFAQIIVKYRPIAFMFENVEGFLTAEDGERVLELLAPLVKAGYRIHLRKVNAANYGVPQHRKRVLAIGGLGWDPTFPEPTHRAYGAPGAALIASDKPTAPTIMDALQGLPPLTPEPGSPQGHWHSSLKKDDLERVHRLKPGQTMRDLPVSLQHESYNRRAFRRVMDGTPTECRGGAPCGVRRLKPDEPSKAITSGARSEFVHPIEDRYLSIRECARIQTFPDDFEFVGTIAEQTLLIGNAVPPLLAEVIGRSLAQQVSDAHPETQCGALLSFVPTSSAGMSPALQRTADAVSTTFGCLSSNERQLHLWE